MSYARFSDVSDVYVYASVGGYVSCCGCPLLPAPDEWEARLTSADEVVAHMQEHHDAGHVVPSRLFDVGLYDDSDFEPWGGE